MNAAKEEFEIWGLTGGIAAGKSTAARIFAEAGLAVLDADQVARTLAAPGGAAHATILARFGTADRTQLRQLVFTDPSARLELEAILHPLIQAESLRQMQVMARAQIKSGVKGARIIYEAALLVETGRYREFAGLIVVDAPRLVRRQRLIARDGISAQLADQILAAQGADEGRLKAATHVLRNEGTETELRARVQALRGVLGWA